MIDHIRAELVALAHREQIRILFAAESGSRAWGFESADSDWDVRFVYVRPRDWYLSIKPGRDVIEETLPRDLDIAGWDLPKALGLYAKSNPALLEWMRSSIIYSQDDQFVAELKALEPTFARPEVGMYHYRSMAKSNLQDMAGRELVSLKKYFYVLRPILACQHIESKGTWPPMAFGELVAGELEDGPIRAAIEQLLARKRATGELGKGPRVVVLDEFIVDEVSRLGVLPIPSSPEADIEPLNVLFRKYLA